MANKAETPKFISLETPLQKAVAALFVPVTVYLAPWPHWCTPVQPIAFYGCPEPSRHHPHIDGENAPEASSSYAGVIAVTTSVAPAVSAAQLARILG